MKSHSDPGRHVVLALSGREMTLHEAKLLRRHAPAGVILFSRNLGALEETAALIRSLVAACDPPPTVWIDQEGGRVQRLRDPLTRYPSALRYAEAEARLGREEAAELARLAGWLCGRELAALGLGVDCAPVLDLREEGANPVIGERAFGDHPEQVIRLAGAWLAGLTSAGVLGMGKHFPGHGAARADSHHALPVVEKSREALLAWELLPFRALLDRLPAMMTAHLVATGVDAEQPATWSAPWLRELLRGAWGYQGLIVSDAVEMGALSGSIAQRTEKALIAGCDLILCCTGKPEDNEAALDGAALALETMDPAWVAASAARIERILAPHRLTPGDWRGLLEEPAYREARRRVEGLREAHVARDPTEASSG
ncbi:MAG: beta-N-acetylhexosaminidase [Magnetococcales bacterium]|nr:beta-N-acetylhexosaminidase [Magnetococcales bacterium]